MRFDRYMRVRMREITPRRLAAAERWRDKEVSKAGLFAAEVDAELPTPEERITLHDEGFAAWWQTMRDHRATKWREHRRTLRTYPADEQRSILVAWGQSRLPGDPSSFGYFMRQWEAERVERTAPPSANELIYLCILSDWTRAPDLPRQDWLIIYGMLRRGLIEKRSGEDGWLQYRAVTEARA